MRIVVNLGGEGEEPGAINVNCFVADNMFNPRFDEALPSELVLRRSAHDTGLDDSSVDVVVANHFPIQRDEFISEPSGARQPIQLLAAEIVRILVPGGSLRFHCSSCDRDSLARSFMKLGIKVRVSNGGRIIGRKP